MTVSEKYRFNACEENMKGFVPIDSAGGVSDIRFAVIYLPGRNRKRFTAGCVTVVESKEEAMQSEDPSGNMYAASVIGPSKSSEGQYVYYLAEWLGQKS